MKTFRGKRGGSDWVKKGEGIRQRTYIHNPWTQATVWGQPEGGGLGDRRRGINRVGGNEGICNSFNNKNKEKTNF